MTLETSKSKTGKWYFGAPYGIFPDKSTMSKRMFPHKSTICWVTPISGPQMDQSIMDLLPSKTPSKHHMKKHV